MGELHGELRSLVREEKREKSGGKFARNLLEFLLTVRKEKGGKRRVVEDAWGRFRIRAVQSREGGKEKTDGEG